MRGEKLLYLSREDVESTNPPMTEIIAALEEMFREKGEGRVEMPPKPGIHTRPDAFIHAMPAYIPKLESAGMKWVSGYPENQTRGLPYITGLIVLNDPETGLPLCVMDCVWVTAKRTGAAPAVAAKYLARDDSETVGILGCGVQGFSNVEALSCIFAVKKVKAFDIVIAAAEKYREKVARGLGIEVEIVRSPEAAVRGSDIIVTAGPILKHPKPVIEDEWFEPGAFGSPVDFDSYWKHEPFQRADKFYTDDVKQMLYYRGVGYFKGIPERILDLGDLVAGKSPGRERDDERILSVNLGLALDDMATAPLVYKRALRMGIGVELEL
jgi:ornithine cyclodeaminase/alanine dehydrogenase-like protein (mu-crystallin family)